MKFDMAKKRSMQKGCLIGQNKEKIRFVGCAFLKIYSLTKPDSFAKFNVRS